MKNRSQLVQWLALALFGVMSSSAAWAQSPQGYWNFNNSGNIGLDSSANASQLTINGDAAYTASGQSGGGLALDGNGDFLSHATVPTGTPLGGSAYTISAWIRPTADGTRGIVGWGNWGTGNGVNAFRTNGNAELINYWWGADQIVNVSPTNLYDGNWHHVVAMHDGTVGGARSIWVDGRLVSQMAAGAGHNAGALNFRIGSTNNTEFFQGTLDDVAIYNTALTGNQIKALATSSANPLALPSAGATSRWVANDLNSLADGASVGAWVDNFAGATLAQGAAASQPTLVKNLTATGSSALRFDGVNDNLRLPAALNPMSGNSDFSIAIAFQTTTAGVGGSGQWYLNTGIVDGEQGGATNDWGLVLNSGGLVGAGLGNPDVTAYSTTNVTDGEFHTAIYTRDDNVLSLYIDGVLESQLTTGGTAVRNFADLAVGSLQTPIANFFNGDIFELQIYDFALSAGQAAALDAELSAAHNFAPAAVPEPASVAAWVIVGGMGLAVALRLKRRRGQRSIAA